MARFSGSITRDWSLEDFDFKINRRSKRKSRDEMDDDADESTSESPGRTALGELLDEFAGYAHDHEGIPYTKASLASKNIYLYLMERYDGGLEPRQNMVDAIMNPQKKPKTKPRKPHHPLCPDHDTLDRYFSSMLGLFAMRTYDVAATFELMPTWLRFLETRGLIDSSRRESTLADIGRLQPTLLKLWESEADYRFLAENIRTWLDNQPPMPARIPAVDGQDPALPANQTNEMHR